MLGGVEELTGWKRKLTIHIQEDEVLQRVERLLDEIGKTAEAPGFRKGKVPRAMLAQKHGASVRAQAFGDVLEGAYVEAVREAGLRPVAGPEFDEIPDAADDGKYTVTATVEVRPEIELRDYEGLSFVERVPIITSEDVDRALDRVREENADLVAVSRSAREGDYVIIDYVRVDETGKPLPETKTENYPCEVGKSVLPPELDAALAGVAVGDEKSVTIDYPEDHGVEELAGKSVGFSVTVRDVKEKRLPPLNDEFAQGLGEFATLLDLRVRIRNRLEAEVKAAAKRRLEEDIVAELIKRNPFDLPETLVERRLGAMYERMSAQQPEGAKKVERSEFDPVYRPVVEHQLKAGLLLQAVAEKHEIEVTRDDVEKRVGLIAEARQQDPAELMKYLDGSDALSQIEDDIWLEKVHDLMVGISNVTTETFDPAEEEKADGTEE